MSVVNYDEKNDVLILEIKKGKYEISEDFNGVIIDFDNNENILRIEILNFSYLVNRTKQECKKFTGLKGNLIFDVDKQVCFKLMASTQGKIKNNLNFFYNDKNMIFDKPIHQNITI